MFCFNFNSLMLQDLFLLKFQFINVEGPLSAKISIFMLKDLFLNEFQFNNVEGPRLEH